MKIEERLAQYIERIEAHTEQCGKTLDQRQMKLSEEVGELARAMNIADRVPGTLYRDRPTHDEILEETADVFIVTMSIFKHHLGEDFADYHEKLFAILDKKLGKWGDIQAIEKALRDNDR